VLTGNGRVILLHSPGPGFRGPAKLGEVTQYQCITIIDPPMHRERAEIAAPTCPRSRCGQAAHSYAVDDPEGHRSYFSEAL
jgi:hypothetical protein